MKKRKSEENISFVFLNENEIKRKYQRFLYLQIRRKHLEKIQALLKFF